MKMTLRDAINSARVEDRNMEQVIEVMSHAAKHIRSLKVKKEAEKKIVKRKYVRKQVPETAHEQG